MPQAILCRYWSDNFPAALRAIGALLKAAIFSVLFIISICGGVIIKICVFRVICGRKCKRLIVKSLGDSAYRIGWRGSVRSDSVGRNGCRDQSGRDSACRMGGCQVAVSNSVGRGRDFLSLREKSNTNRMGNNLFYGNLFRRDISHLRLPPTQGSRETLSLSYTREGADNLVFSQLFSKIISSVW